MRRALLLLSLLPVWALAQTSSVADGRRAYMAAGCYECHGLAGQGGVGPRLAPKPMAAEALIVFVRNSPRNMPAYPPQVITDAELRSVHDFLAAMEASPGADQIPQLR